MAKSSSGPPSWLSPQQSFLALLTLAITSACIHAIQPSSIRTNHIDYDFPEDVPLPGWLPAPQGVGTAPEGSLLGVEDSAILPTGTEVAAARYVYLSNFSGQEEGDRSPIELAIEMRYFTDSNGDAKSYIHQVSGDLQSALQYRDGVGSYGVYSDGDWTYATGCINPTGGSTVLSDDYRSNRYRHDFRISRIWNWAFGRSAIQDRRCLWTHLSVKLNSSTFPELSTELVEPAWLDWLAWWNENYPN